MSVIDKVHSLIENLRLFIKILTMITIAHHSKYHQWYNYHIFVMLNSVYLCCRFIALRGQSLVRTILTYVVPVGYLDKAAANVKERKGVCTTFNLISQATTTCYSSCGQDCEKGSKDLPVITIMQVFVSSHLMSILDLSHKPNHNSTVTTKLSNSRWSIGCLESSTTLGKWQP